MRPFTVIYFPQIHQHLLQPSDLHSVHDTIIQQIIDSPTQATAYIMCTSDHNPDLQEIMQTHNSMAFKNNIILVNVFWSPNLSNSEELTIKEETNVNHQKFKYFNCQLGQHIKLLPTCKIVNHITQLFSDHSTRSIQEEYIKHSAESCTSKVPHENIKANNKIRTEIQCEIANYKLNERQKLKCVSNLSQKIILATFCNETLLKKDTVINLISFAISNIKKNQNIVSDVQQHVTAAHNFQPNSWVTFAPAYQKSSNHQTIINVSSNAIAKTSYEQKFAKFHKLVNRDFGLCVDTKMHYLNMLDKNYQTLSNYQAQITEAFENCTGHSTMIPKHQFLNKRIEGISDLFDRQEVKEHESLETHGLIVTMEETNENLQIQKAECKQIIYLQKAQFYELLRRLLCEVTKNLNNQFSCPKEPPKPEGIMCIKLDLLQCEVASKSCNKIISLINLLRNYFKYFTYIYSEDSHQVQQEIIKSFQNKLQIDGHISINSDEKVSIVYDSNTNRYACTFPNTKENWSDYFEINRNYVFCICNDAGKIIVSKYEESLEYQNLFESLHTIYEDQLILRIFYLRDELSGNSHQLLRSQNDFVLDTRSNNFCKENKDAQLFLLAENTERVFINQVSTTANQKEGMIAKYKGAFALKMYSFFGVNVPYCCLSNQLPESNSVADKSNYSLQSCLMIECIKECQYFSTTFITDYKNNQNQYYYYPSTLEEGPLIGFGSALLAAHLLDDDDFFGSDFRNVCFIKKSGYFEFTKLTAVNVLSAHSHENPELSIFGCGNVILASSGANTITFADLCEYDKFECTLQISKLAGADRFAEELWNQFINTQYSEQFKIFESEWACKMQKIMKMLLKDSQNSVCSAQKQSSSSMKNSASKNNNNNIFASTLSNSLSEKVSSAQKQSSSSMKSSVSKKNKNNLFVSTLSNSLSEKSTFFTREQKYIAEETDLGAGCFGVVSIAHLIGDPSKKFALKRLFDNKRILRDGGEINAGKNSVEFSNKQEHDRELEALMKVKRIRSPFLVGYVGAQLLKNETKGTQRLELIMELCNGDLSSYLENLKKKKQKLSLSDCYTIFCQIVEGLCFLHYNQIMHRDIKPQNILYKTIKIEGEEIVVWKIGDFGLASMKDEIELAAGTPEYMAPEMRRDEPYNKSVDVWSLGLVFHKILFGYDYFDKNSLKMDYNLQQDEKSLISIGTVQLLFMMMKTNPKERIQIENIKKMLFSRQEYQVVRKILNFVEMNQRTESNENECCEFGNLSLENREKEIINLLHTAAEWVALGCYKKSLNMLIEAWKNKKKLKLEEKNRFYLLLHFSIGDSYVKLGQYKEALEHYNISLKYQIDNFGEECVAVSRTYKSIGVVYDLLGEYEKSIQYKNQALVIAQKVDSKDYFHAAMIYESIGTTLDYTGNYKEALKYKQSSLEIFVKHLGQEHPEIARVKLNIGKTYDFLGNYEEAMKCFQDALNINAKNYGENHIETAICFEKIAFAFCNLGRYEEALKNINIALKAFILYYGEEHINTVPSFECLGLIYCSLGKYNESLLYACKTLQINQKFYGENHIDVANSYQHIGSVLCNLGKDNEGLNYFNQSLQIHLNSSNQNHCSIALIYENIANAFNRLANNEKAVEYINYALEYSVKFYGEEHIQTARIYGNLGCMLQCLGRHNESFEYLNKTLKIQINNYGNEHIKLAVTYINIGITLVGLNKYSESLKYSMCAREIGLKHYEKNHIYLAKIDKNIGVALYYLGEIEESFYILTNSLKIYVSYYGENHLDTAEAYSFIGIVLRSLNRLEEAIKYFYCCLQIYITNLGENHVNTGKVYENIGQTYIKLEQNKKSLLYFEKALKINISNFKQNHIETAIIYRSIADANQQLGNYVAAYDNYSNALKIFSITLAEDNIEIADTYGNFGRLLRLMGRYEEALNYLDYSLKLIIKHYGQDHINVAITHNNISSVLKALGRHKLAIEHCAKALPQFIANFGEFHKNTVDLRNLIKELQVLLSKAFQSLQKALNNCC